MMIVFGKGLFFAKAMQFVRDGVSDDDVKGAFQVFLDFRYECSGHFLNARCQILLDDFFQHELNTILNAFQDSFSQALFQFFPGGFIFC